MLRPDEPLPTLVFPGLVLFPGAHVELEVADPAGLAALAAAAPPSEPLVWIGVPTLAEGPLRPDTLAPIGTAARVHSRLRLPGGGERVSLQGSRRLRARAIHVSGELWLASVEPLAAPEGRPDELTRERVACLALLHELGRTERVPLALACAPSDLGALAGLNAESPDELVDFVARALELPRTARLELLCEERPLERLRLLERALRELLLVARDEGELDATLRARLHQGFLREKLRLLREELGEEDPLEVEARELERRIVQTSLSPAARALAERELARLRRTARSSAQASQIRNHLEWLLELPWQARRWGSAAGSPLGTVGPASIDKVRRTLDRSYTGLADVKERVTEFLAVHKLRRRGDGTALCFLGPPGTGKSSMGRAVAQALGRQFVHIAVGSITDETELRGISYRQENGAPGVILEGVHRAGTLDPVILLDEIDKLELGGSGTAGGALLEILDSDHNAEFYDHYLGVPFDLSRCIFLATADDVEEVSEALVDRLEIIEFAGYTESEKLEIARSHLLPQARRRAGLSPAQLTISPAAMLSVVRSYTEEAGVRQLRRVLSSLARKAAVEVVQSRSGLRVRKRDLLPLLGPAVADEDLRLRRPAVGVATGLAWTSAGGSLLPVEALVMPGSGRTLLTGQVGDVMRESVQTSLSYVRTLFKTLALRQESLDQLDVHIHFPSGGIPKDGPSAGVAIAIALLSLFTRTPVRHNVAMTGELSLLGNVLPVGGMRDKLLAALRSGIREVVVPARNEEEIGRLPEEIRGKLTIHLIDHVQDAFGLTLARGRGKLQRAPPLPVLRSRAARRASGNP